MDDHCRCGEALRHAYENWRCAGCGRACCPGCADAIDGRARCVACASQPASAAAA
jgi:hypothetical protein